MQSDPKSNQKRVYEYIFPSPIYAANWSFNQNLLLKHACGTFLNDYNNKIYITYLDVVKDKIVKLTSFNHPYPATKIHWIPDFNANYPELLASSGDYLRIWHLQSDNQIVFKCLLNNNRHTNLCAPLTSFDWNRSDPSIIITASIDTTCTIWSVETQQVVSNVPSGVKMYKQLIAHEREVYDVAFSSQGTGKNVFGTAGADGSIRTFDIRNLNHSNVIYQHKLRNPLLRIYWNLFDSNYIATFCSGSNEIIIIDVRMAAHPVAELTNHESNINAVSWAPQSNNYLCSVGSDKKAFIWNIPKSMFKSSSDPILCYTATDEINQIQWNDISTDRISICFSNIMQILRV